MKTRWSLWSVVLLWCVLVFIISGCVSNKKVDAILAQTRDQALRQSATEAVLLELAKRDNGVIPDTVANVEEGSTVGWARAKRAVRTADNQPLLDKDGAAQFEVVEAIGKSKSSREFGNITRGTIKLAGLGFDLQTGVLNPTSILEGVVVNIEGSGGSTVNADWARAWGEAVTAEKSAILSGMANLATARGAAWAVRFNAAADGISRVVTSLGEVTGKILTATVIPTPADLAAQGVSKLVEAVIETSTGKKTILAADTPTSRAATDCEGCVYNGE